MAAPATPVSAKPDGTVGGGSSLFGGAAFRGFEQAITPDGRFVVFASDNDALTPGDGNGFFDVFLRDLQSGTTTLVSKKSGAETSANDGSGGYAAVSADGRYVVFQSFATDLAAPDNDGDTDVFVRDVQSGTTELVSVNAGGTDSGNGDSTMPVMTPDGRYVAFVSAADNIAAPDADTDDDVFVRDMVSNTTALVSTNDNGTDSANQASFNPLISADGRFVAFLSNGTDVTTIADSNAASDIFLRDMTAGSQLVSVNAAGTAPATGQSGGPTDLTPDGRYVAFSSEAFDVTTDPDSNGGSPMPTGATRPALRPAS